jgi:hypothetical protein
MALIGRRVGVIADRPILVAIFEIEQPIRPESSR